MNVLLKKLIDNGRKDAFESVENFKKAAAEFGYTEAQVEEFLTDFDGVPLSDDDLQAIAGGYGRPYRSESIRPWYGK